MTIPELKEKIDDTSITDEAIFQILLAFFKDDAIDTASIDDMASLGAHTDQRRPQVLARLRRQIAENHRDCCGND